MAQETPPKSNTTFILLVCAVIVIGGGFIFSKKRSAAPAPVVLAANTPLPKAEGYLEGKADAPVTLLEFADFECPGCKEFATKTEPELRSHYIDSSTVSLRYFDFPLSMHANTMSASLAAACAADQGKFWPMHDLLFKTQDDWHTQATTNPKQVFDGLVAQLGSTRARSINASVHSPMCHALKRTARRGSSAMCLAHQP